ncbi:MAG: VCBS repeat-containing protein [Phycisphaerae bacterium]|nr:VCBS repeat-containing protein [Phycisphaerae bacterium]MCZ2399564.1 VCBS repeat-containing protein [Phycisphaerae bacterium]NUQ49439.1 VCBS repeat-containing protein [Phycisphaerae bacterium]
MKPPAHILLAFAPLVVCDGLPRRAAGQLAFRPAVHTPVGQRPSGVVIARLNADAFADVAVTSDNPDKLIIFLGSAAGALGLGPAIELPEGVGASAVVAGRLDAGLSNDLAVGLQNAGAVAILLNTGGDFALAATVAVGNNPRGMDTAGGDLVVANRDSNTATLLLNDGNAVFSTMTLPAGDEPRAAIFGDFNGDGLRDVAISNHDDRTISIYLGTPRGLVAAADLFVGAGLRPDALAAADLNGDGLDDLAVATDFATVFLSTGAGFSGPVHYPVGGDGPSGITVDDFNCDGLPDIATSHADAGSASVIPNMGGGVFGGPLVLAIGQTNDGIAAGDIDGDGDPDLVVINRDANTLSLLINDSCTPIIPGDLDGDGDVDQADLGILLAFYGCVGECPGDINADGAVDQADLGILLANYGS